MRHDDRGPTPSTGPRRCSALEPNNADAHYVLAAEALEERRPNIPEIKRHLAVLEAAKASAGPDRLDQGAGSPS